MIYGTAKWVIDPEKGRYSLSFVNPSITNLIDDLAYLGPIVYNGLTTQYFFSMPEGTDVSSIVVPFSIEIMTKDQAVQWLWDNTSLPNVPDMEEEGKYVFLVSPERTDTSGVFQPAKYMVVQ